MICNIYKSLKKADTYLFLDKSSSQDKLPENLLNLLGDVEWVMELDITPDKKLAREQGDVILEAIADQGFYLQLPPIKI